MTPGHRRPSRPADPLPSPGRLTRRINDILSEIGIPDPWDLRAFLDRVGDHQGRSIIACHLEMPVDGPHGLVLRLAETDIIIVDPKTSELHSEHTVLHEVGHIMLCHPGEPVDFDATLNSLRGRAFAEAGLPDSIPAQPPDVPPVVLHRTTMYEAHEAAAELFATLTWRRCGRSLTARDRHLSGAAADAVDRFNTTMGRVDR